MDEQRPCEVRFVGTSGVYGPFRDRNTAACWANAERDGHAFTIHRAERRR